MNNRAKILRHLSYQLPNNPKTYLYLFVSSIVSIFAIALFLELADFSQNLFKYLNADIPYLSLALTPAVFAAIVYFDKNSLSFFGGSGVPQLIAATDSRNKKIRLILLSFKIAIGKIFLVSFSVLGGASVSFGGPSVHIGSSIFYNFSHRIKLKRKLLINAIIAMGGSVGLIVAFNAPIAGFLFAFEEIGRNLKKQALVLIAIVIFISYMIASIYHGKTPYLANLDNLYFDIANIWRLIPLVIITGILGALFAKLALNLISKFVFAKNSKVVIFAIVCGLIVGSINSINIHASGSGEREIVMMLSGDKLGYEYIFAKFISSLASFASTIAGGLFMTSISIGAAIGSELSDFYQQIDMQVMVLFGMVSYLSAVIRTPLAAAFLVLEMSGSLELILPSLLIAFVSSYISKQISKKPIYEALADYYLKASNQKGFTTTKITTANNIRTGNSLNQR